MATNLNINTQFKGLVAGDIIGKMFLDLNTLQKSVIDAIINVTGSYAYLRAINLEDGLKDYTCKFEPSGGVDFNEKEVRLKKVAINLDICKEKFRDTWEGYQMGFSAINDSANIPTTPLEALLLEIRGLVNQAVELDIWQGDYKKSGHFGGILTELVHDTKFTPLEVKDENGAAIEAITAKNVEDVLTAVIEATDITVLQASDFKLLVDTKTLSRYNRSLRLANFQLANNEFDGYPMESVNGLPENTVLTYTARNFKFLTGLKEDFNEIKVMDMSEKTNDDTIQIKVVYQGGASYVREEYIVAFMGKSTVEQLKLKKPNPTRWIVDTEEIEDDTNIDTGKKASTKTTAKKETE